MSFDYGRYLEAKVSVDDRALNRVGLGELQRLLTSPAPRVLEIGAGLGTMVARLLDWGVLAAGEYTLLDVDPGLLSQARDWLSGWARRRDLPCTVHSDGLSLGRLRVRFVPAELGAYLRGGPQSQVDLLVGNAVLDLVDLPVVLPAVLRLIAPGGSYWFTINYDGDTIFAPDHPHDTAIMAAYHRDMDTRLRHGRPSGDSRTGRHLFPLLATAGAPALFAGASDWVVYPDSSGRYPHDEQYFLGCILDTVQGALRSRHRPGDRAGRGNDGGHGNDGGGGNDDGGGPPVSPTVLADWLATRRAQLAAGELVYLAHQLDFVGRVSR